MSSVHSGVAPHAHNVIVVGPGGPANTICPGRVVRSVVGVTHRGGLIVFSSRVCSHLLVSKIRRVSPTTLTPSLFAIAFGKLSGSRYVYNFEYT